MKAHRIAGIILTLALLSAVLGCSKSQQQSKVTGDRELNILCTILPLYVLAQNVVEGASGVSLSLLLSPQIGCPHDYALTPTDAAELEKADVVVMNGLGMETFLQGSPALERPNVRVLVASATVDSIPSDEDRAVRGSNPHAWVSPFEAEKMAMYLGAELGRVDTANAVLYLRNAQKYAARLDSLGQALRQVVMRAPNRRIVTYHNAFDYFARDSGLEITGVVMLDPAEGPSARALSDLEQRIKKANVMAIFSEPQYSDRLPKMLSSETGVPVYSLDPAASGDSDGESYLRIMRQNLLTLEKVLSIGR